MMKNLLAAIGLCVVAKKGYDFYCEYRELKAENACLRKGRNGMDSSD